MRRLGLDDLRAIVTDGAELAKGAVAFDEGGLRNLARHGDKIYADAAGSSAAPYKVVVTVGDRAALVKARCSCMAARSRPFCKHAAALLVAWARTPEAFVESDAPPPSTDRRRRIKKGAADAAQLMAAGIARVVTLVGELAAAGVAARAGAPRDELRALADTLRAGRLRRLAVRVHELADLLDTGGPLAGVAYADLLSDLLLTARKIEKHLGGEPLDDRHVEELIGKTWRKPDRAPIEGLDLVEYAYRVWTTADDFVIRESRYLDLAGGGHWSEKQILPAFMARRSPVKPSRAGVVLRGAGGGVYPGYPPRRLDLEVPGEATRLDGAALERLIDRATAAVAVVVAAFRDHRKDLFAPDVLPVALRVSTLVADGPRHAMVDGSGLGLAVPDDPLLIDQLAAVLRGATLRAVLGDVGLDRALLVLVPRALVVARGGALELWPVTGALDLAAARGGRPAPTTPADWAAQLRDAGASGAAVALAEVRAELADLLSQGLPRVTTRAVDALVARLGELGLARPAQLLADLAARPDPAARLDDLIRVYQVLGVALVRLVAARRIELDALVAVPGWPSVWAAPPAAPAAADELTRAGLSRWDVAIHAGRALDALSLAELAARPALWADAELGPLVAAAVAARPGGADAARAILGQAGRIADLTAIRMLAAADPRAALAAFKEHLAGTADVGLRAAALHVVDLALGDDPDALRRRHERRRIIAELARLVAGSADAQARAKAAGALGELGDPLAAGVPLRAALEADPDDDVREASALALARLGDPDAVGDLVRELRAGCPHLPGRVVARAVAASGDAAGLAALVDALAAGWSPAAVAAGLAEAGPTTLPVILDAIDRDPTLAKRKTVARAALALAARGLGTRLSQRLDAFASSPAATPDIIRARASAYLQIARLHPDAHRAVAATVVDLLGTATDKAAKAAVRAARRALSAPRDDSTDDR